MDEEVYTARVSAAAFPATAAEVGSQFRVGKR